MEDNPIIFFDGVCNLCNASVDFILKWEKKPQFKLASIQSEKAKELLESFKNDEISDSVLLLQGGKLYQKSSSALRIARELRFFWILYYLIYIPVWLRDPIYSFIARNRYRWFGKRETCRMPDENLKNRFL